MAFPSCLLAFFMLLLSSFFFIASSSSEVACNFNDVFTFGIAKTSVSSNALVLPHLLAASDHIKGESFGGPESFIMHQEFFLRHGILPLEGSSSLDSQIAHFLDFLVGGDEDPMEKLQNTLIVINHPGLMDYLHALQVRSELTVLYFVPEVVAEIKNAVRRLINAGASNIVVSGLKPRELLGLETLAESHRDHLYEAVGELRVEFPKTHISHLDYVRMGPKGKDRLFTSLQVSEACQSFLEREGHLL